MKLNLTNTLALFPMSQTPNSIIEMMDKEGNALTYRRTIFSDFEVGTTAKSCAVGGPLYDDRLILETQEENRIYFAPLSEILKNNDNAPLYVLMCEENTTTGCTAILFPNMKSRIKNAIGDFYLLPSSIHEWIIVPKIASTVQDLGKIVRSVNDKHVRPEEQLSDYVYKFGKRGSLTRA